MADGEDAGWLGWAVARVFCVKSRPCSRGRWDRGARVGLPRTEPLVMDRDKRHSTLLTRERRGFPIWSAFEHDIRAFVL